MQDRPKSVRISLVKSKDRLTNLLFGLSRVCPKLEICLALASDKIPSRHKVSSFQMKHTTFNVGLD